MVTWVEGLLRTGLVELGWQVVDAFEVTWVADSGGLWV